MARNMSSPAFLLAALVFFAATTLPAHALLPSLTLRPITLPPVTLPPVIPNNINRPVNITVQLRCPNGTTGGQPISGALVNVTCRNLIGATNLVGQNTTNANGTATISITLNPASLPICSVAVGLTNVTCPVLGTANALITFIFAFIGNVVVPLVNNITNGVTVSVN